MQAAGLQQARGRRRCAKRGLILCFASYGGFCLSFCVFGVRSVLFPCFRLSSCQYQWSAIDCLERVVSEMIYYMLSGM